MTTKQSVSGIMLWRFIEQANEMFPGFSEAKTNLSVHIV
jgi:hypothetical protein